MDGGFFDSFPGLGGMFDVDRDGHLDPMEAGMIGGLAAGIYESEREERAHRWDSESDDDPDDEGDSDDDWDAGTWDDDPDDDWDDSGDGIWHTWDDEPDGDDDDDDYADGDDGKWHVWDEDDTDYEALANL